MSDKTKRIVSLVLAILPSLMLLMSAVMKLSGAQEAVDGFNKMGLGSYIAMIGIIELISVVLFMIPKTNKLGFLLLCSYLGGAISLELSQSHFPVAAVILSIIWISQFLKNKGMFLS